MNRQDELKQTRIKIARFRKQLDTLKKKGKGARDPEVKYYAELVKVWTAYEIEIEHLSGCCADEVELGKTFMSSGEYHVSAVCSICHQNVKVNGQWVSKKSLPQEVLNNLDTFKDYRGNNPVCEVCGATGTQEHHWAPKELFPDSFEDWPKSYLCTDHHTEWHNKITTPLRALKRKIPKNGKG